MNKNKITVNELLSSDRYLFHADRIQRARSLKQLTETTVGIMNDEELPEKKMNNLLHIIRARTLLAIELLHVD